MKDLGIFIKLTTEGTENHDLKKKSLMATKNILQQCHRLFPLPSSHHQILSDFWFLTTTELIP